jgi:hypothetical protein
MPSTRTRVPRHTAEAVNSRIRRDIACSVQYFAEHKDEIARRLRELDAEWDIERAIEANAAALGFIGTALGLMRGRKWLVLPLAVTGFLFQHAVEGWCPPVPLLRRLGFRTSFEIEEERQALKALRGDFDAVSKASDAPAAALRAVQG